MFFNLKRFKFYGFPVLSYTCPIFSFEFMQIDNYTKRRFSKCAKKERHWPFPSVIFYYIAPFPVRTTQMVIRKILKSVHMPRSRMYFKSLSTQVSKSGFSLRPPMHSW